MSSSQFQSKADVTRLNRWRLSGLGPAKAFWTWLLVVAGWMSVGLAQAQDTAAAFNEANHLYEKQKFSEAAAAYEKILQDTKVSSGLLFNAGNAYFKAGQTGKAIAAYRQAEKLSPRDSDVQTNLKLARDEVQNSKPPTRSLGVQFLNYFSLNEWTVVAAIFFWFWFILLIVGQWKRDLSKSLRFYLMASGLLACGTILCTILTLRLTLVREAVIVKSEAVVRKGPFDESQSAFTLRDGAEVTVLDSRESWLQVSDTANRTGWISQNQALILR